MSRILIVGAGLSGLTAARELASRGHEVVIVDKSRGVGGRMATRRFAGGAFDTGAQFFTVRSQPFASEVAAWQSSEVAERWFEGSPSPHETKSSDGHPRFRGVPGMTGVAKFLMQGLDVRTGEEIERLEHENGVWHAFSQSGTTFQANRLLLTAPIPQSLALLATSGLTLPPELAARLNELRYEPCFAVLAQFAHASALPAPGLFYINGDPVWWLADNFQKGVSPRPGSVTIHSSGAFARANYDLDQRQVGETLIAAARQWLGNGEIEAFDVRRWRYSRPENPLDIGAIAVPELGLVFAGDALGGAKVEGAFLSGLKAAEICA